MQACRVDMLRSVVRSNHCRIRLSICQLHYRSLALRNDLLPGFDAAVAVFETWMPLLLLRAAQSLGFFQVPGATTTSAQLAAMIVPAYRRFTAEMLAMLQRSGASKDLRTTFDLPLRHCTGDHACAKIHNTSTACMRAGAHVCSPLSPQPCLYRVSGGSWSGQHRGDLRRGV